MLARDKLAVLVPTYNGGVMLRETVMSCARSGLPASDYEILVVDNCSTDGSVDDMPPVDERGATIRVFKNDHNLGRVGNWNKAVSVAGQKGFTYATFLFVGDSWVANGSIASLLSLMRESNAFFGIAPLNIVDADGRHSKVYRRVSIPGTRQTVESERFLEQALSTGALPLAPLQANVYRIGDNSSLVFDAEDASHADIKATIDFLVACRDPVAIVSRPYVSWRAHAGRAHMTFDPVESFRKDIAVVESTSRDIGLDLDWGRVHAGLLLRCASAYWKRPWPLLRMLRLLHRENRKTSVAQLARMVLAKLLRGQSMVHFASDSVRPHWHVIRKSGSARLAVDLKGGRPQTVTRLLAGNDRAKRILLTVAVRLLRCVRSYLAPAPPPLSHDQVTAIVRHLARHIDAAVTTSDPSLSLYFGTPSPYTSKVLQIVFGPAGAERRFFAKIPQTPAAKAAVRNEAEILGSLAADSSIGPHLPPLVGAGSFGSGYAMLIGGVDGRPPSPGWIPEFDEMFRGLYSHDRDTAKWQAGPTSRLVQEAARALDEMGRKSEARLLVDCDWRLRHEWGSVALPFTRCHGDFVPWNVRRDGDRFFVLDWEWSRRETIGHDPFNYIVAPLSRRAGGADRVGDWSRGGGPGLLLDRIVGEDRQQPWYRPDLLFISYLVGALAFHIRNFHEFHAGQPGGTSPLPPPDIVVLERLCRGFADASL